MNETNQLDSCCQKKQAFKDVDSEADDDMEIIVDDMKSDGCDEPMTSLKDRTRDEDEAEGFERGQFADSTNDKDDIGDDKGWYGFVCVRT